MAGFRKDMLMEPKSSEVQQDITEDRLVPVSVALPSSVGDSSWGWKMPVDDASVAQGGGLGVAGGPGAQPVPPQPLFHHDDINVQSLAGLTPHLQINPQVALLQQYPHLKQYVRPAVEKAVQDLLVPVAERSIKIALTTTEHVIKKDFALDPDIHRMHLAAHHMVRHLTAGMALITCRERLLLSISANLKAAFTSALRAQAEDLKPLIEQAAHQVSAENTELACAFIQKTSMEKATPEMDKRLAEEFELRRRHHNEGHRYCNTAVLIYQAGMPKRIRLNVGGPSPQQAGVYEEFSRCIPGFLPSSTAKQMEFGMQFGSGGVGTQQVKHTAHPSTQLQQQQQHLSQVTKPLGDPILVGPDQAFSKDVDDKANAYFQAIFNRSMNVDRLLDLLKQFKDSNNKKERDLFVCMLRNMFEEYKFFPQFPEKELQITGQLFGGIIEHGLVTYMPLSLALRYVLESLKKPPGSNMYLFGIAALDKFKTRLHEFPQYCASIAGIPHFQSFPNFLKQYVQFGQQSIEPPAAALSSPQFVPNEEFLQILLKCIQEISQHLRVALAPPNNPHILMMRALLEMTMQLRISQSHQNVISLLQKALEGLLEGMNPPPSDPDLFVSFRDCHLLILKMVQGHSGLGPETAMYHVTRILLSDIKYSPRAIILLIGMQIVNMKQLDEHLAKAVANGHGRNLVALSCSIKLVNAIVSAEKRETPITDKGLLKTKKTLYRLAANVKLLPDSSAQLLEPFRITHNIQERANTFCSIS